MDALVTLILIVVVLGALAWSVFASIHANRRIVRLERALRQIGADAEMPELLDVVASHVEATRHLDAHTATVEQRIGVVQDELRSTVRHVGLVRYDAFGDVTGTQSWSVALLDDQSDGIVLTSLADQESSWVYAKAVRRGAGADADLSSEERTAVATAGGTIAQEPTEVVDVSTESTEWDGQDQEPWSMDLPQAEAEL